MKHSRHLWILMGIIALIYTAILVTIRLENPKSIQKTTYIRWRQAYVINQAKGRAFVNTSNNRRKPVALSEGQGYGLCITAWAGEKGWAQEKDYRHLLNYYLAHRDTIKSRRTYLMAWRQAFQKGKWASQANSATDGDLFIAASLQSAAKVWPQHASYYRQLEQKVCADILHYEYNPHTRSLTVGDWAKTGSKYYRLMRTSDVAPSFFDQFYRLSHDQRWRTAKNGMLDHLLTLSKQHKTGLVPDFAWVGEHSAKPVRPNAVASKNDGNYSANACRVPMMLADCKDPRAQKVLTKMMKFFAHRQYVTAGYRLNGKQLNHYQSDSFSAPIFYAVSANRGRGYDNLFESQKHIFAKPLTKHNYYDATLTTIAVLKGMR